MDLYDILEPISGTIIRLSLVIFVAPAQIRIHKFIIFRLLIACPGTKCFYNDARLNMHTFNVSQNDDVLSSTLVAYLFVVNMYTGAGIIKTSPIKPTEVILTCVIALFTQYVITNLCSAYASMVLIDKYNFSKYEVRFKRLATYLQVSIPNGLLRYIYQPIKIDSFLTTFKMLTAVTISSR